MMATIEKRDAPLVTKRPEQTDQTDNTTMCAFCGVDRNVYQMGDQWICADHLAAAVSLAACDIWPDMVRYTHAFEAAVLM